MIVRVDDEIFMETVAVISISPRHFHRSYQRTSHILCPKIISYTLRLVTSLVADGALDEAMPCSSCCPSVLSLDPL